MLKLLVDELVESGVEVTLFTVGQSRTRARQVSFLQEAPTAHMGETLYDALHAGLAFREICRGGFDLVHDHSGFIPVAFAGRLSVPLVHTLHGPFEPPVRMFYEAFAFDAHYVTISRYQQTRCPGLNYAGVVYNAVDLQEHRPLGDKEDYIVYVSRLCEDKGAHHAVRIARELGRKIVLAGKIDPGRDREFFRREIEPHLDGDKVIYEGEVPQSRKAELMARARAFLFPIQWEEPFGLVMAEALACGTPVVTTRWGAAPEVVEHGKTGFVAESMQEVPSLLERIDEIDPAVCRAEAERRFSPRAMALGYLDIYRKVLGQKAGSRDRAAAG
jgi:glycosyltransferase involved in cell wall biosynthesis